MNQDSLIIETLRKKIRALYCALEKARDLDAAENMLGAIRRKIFEAQDQLVMESIRQQKEISPRWYAGK